MPTRTELHFHYEPPDYFEAKFVSQMKHGQLTADKGLAVYILSSATDPVEEAFRQQIAEEVGGVFKLRQMIVRLPHKLTGPSLIQFTAERKRNVTMYLEPGRFSITGGNVDIKIRDAVGNVKTDTKAERIQTHEAFIGRLLAKLDHPVLRAMVDSYVAATDDLDNELIHLYEVRDAARKHYGNDNEARAALRISRSDWSELGRLANDEPLRQGRHRGAHVAQLRDASEAELAKARSIAEQIIEAFAAVI